MIYGSGKIEDSEDDGGGEVREDDV